MVFAGAGAEGGGCGGSRRADQVGHQDAHPHAASDVVAQHIPRSIRMLPLSMRISVCMRISLLALTERLSLKPALVILLFIAKYLNLNIIRYEGGSGS